MFKTKFSEISSNLDFGKEAKLTGKEQEQLKKMENNDLSAYLEKNSKLVRERWLANITFGFFALIALFLLAIWGLSNLTSIQDVEIIRQLTTIYQNNTSMSFFIFFGFSFVFSLVQFFFIRKLHKELNIAINLTKIKLEELKPTLIPEEYSFKKRSVLKKMAGYLMLEKRKFFGDLLTSLGLILVCAFVLSGGLHKLNFTTNSSSQPSEIQQVQENEYGTLQNSTEANTSDSPTEIKNLISE